MPGRIAGRLEKGFRTAAHLAALGLRRAVAVEAPGKAAAARPGILVAALVHRPVGQLAEPELSAAWAFSSFRYRCADLSARVPLLFVRPISRQYFRIDPRNHLPKRSRPSTICHFWPVSFCLVGDR